MPYTVLDQSTAAAAPVTSAGAPLTSVGMEFGAMLEEMVAQLQNRKDIGTDFSTWTRPKLWLNWGYLNIAQMVDLKELWSSVQFNAVNGQPFYKVPDALSWVKRLVIEDPDYQPYTNGEELEMIDEATYRNLPDTEAYFGPGTENNPNLPDAYFRYQRMLVVYPTPSVSVNLTCDFRVRPLDLVNETDSPLLPPEFHEAILYAGLERAWRALRNPGAAAIAANDKLTIIRPLLNTDANERDAMHATMTPVTERHQLYFRRPR